MTLIIIFVLMGAYAFHQYRKTRDENHLWGLRIAVTVLMTIAAMSVYYSPWVMYGAAIATWFAFPHIARRWL